MQTAKGISEKVCLLETGFEKGESGGIPPYMFGEAVPGIRSSQEERAESLERVGDVYDLCRASLEACG